jgi:hypothetical protein
MQFMYSGIHILSFIALAEINIMSSHTIFYSNEACDFWLISITA